MIGRHEKAIWVIVLTGSINGHSEGGVTSSSSSSSSWLSSPSLDFPINIIIIIIMMISTCMSQCDDHFDPSQFYRVHIWCSPLKGESIKVVFSMPALLICQPVCDERPHFRMIEHRYKLRICFCFVFFYRLHRKHRSASHSLRLKILLFKTRMVVMKIQMLKFTPLNKTIILLKSPVILQRSGQ